uniref:Uncharacterized protein n=1 Tax=Acrobeloides nanus TaxID=290746 RepID=A0A914EBS8_9BILA
MVIYGIKSHESWTCVLYLVVNGISILFFSFITISIFLLCFLLPNFLIKDFYINDEKEFDQYFEEDEKNLSLEEKVRLLLFILTAYTSAFVFVTLCFMLIYYCFMKNPAQVEKDGYEQLEENLNKDIP